MSSSYDEPCWGNMDSGKGTTDNKLNDPLYKVKDVLQKYFIQTVPDEEGIIRTDSTYMLLDDLAKELQDAANMQMIADNRNYIQPIYTLVELLKESTKLLEDGVFSNRAHIISATKRSVTAIECIINPSKKE